MFPSSRINALLVLIVAVLFYFFFMFCKHDWRLAAVNPFGDDPYDAVGSFGIQAAALLGLLSAARTLRPAASAAQRVLLLRTQIAALLAVAVTLALDLMALIRWPAVWMGTNSGYELIGLLGAMALVTLLAGWLVWRTTAGLAIPNVPKRWARPLAASLLAAAVAGFYPTSWSQTTVGALGTVLVGILLLFPTMWAWGTALLPDDPADRSSRVRAATWWQRSGYTLGLTLVLGIAIGTLLVIAESTEGGLGPVVPVRLWVAAIYIGLETAGLLIGYAFLSSHLGLFRRSSLPVEKKE